MKPTGWPNESERHALSSHGINTKFKGKGKYRRLDFTSLNNDMSKEEKRTVRKMRKNIIDRFLSQFDDDEHVSLSFDLTDFYKLDFDGIVNDFDLDYVGRVENEYGTPQFVWKNDDIAISTINNPLTGEWHIKEDMGRIRPSEPEYGYASYVGFYGKKEDLKPLLYEIVDVAEYIKDMGTGFTSVPKKTMNKIAYGDDY